MLTAELEHREDAVTEVLRRLRTHLTTPDWWSKKRPRRSEIVHDALMSEADTYCAVRSGVDAYGMVFGIEVSLNVVCCDMGGVGNFRFWVDEPNRTHADVLALLDRAISDEGGNSGTNP